MARKEIEEVEDQFSVRFTVVAEADHQTNKGLCLGGVGMAILPASLVAAEIASGQLRRIDVEGFPRSRAYFAVYRVGEPPTPEVESLVGALKEWGRRTQDHPGTGCAAA